MSLYSPYRWCVALNCNNSTLKTPEKLFITVPNDVSVRHVWLELAGRDSTKYSEKSHLYLCEDHFDLEQDMENYMRYKIMGSVKKIRMKFNTIPSKFSHMPIASPSREVDSSSTSVLPEVPEWPDDAELNSDDDDDEVERALYQPPVSAAFKKKKTAPEDASTEASGKEDAAIAGSSRLHAGFRCDQCRGDIVGSRYCCVECPNYDLCGACEASGHHATHYVLRVPSNKPHVEVIAVLENIRNALLQREDAENECDQEPEVKVEAPEPALGPDPLAAAPDPSDEQEEKFTIDESPAETVESPEKDKRDILGDIVVKLELDEDQLMMESVQTVPEAAVYSHSARAAPVPMSNIKEYSGGGDGSRIGSGRGSGSDSGSGCGGESGEGYAVYTHSAARPAPVLQGSNVTQEKVIGTSSAKRKTDLPPQHAKVKKK